jgi:hypothetical protein
MYSYEDRLRAVRLYIKLAVPASMHRLVFEERPAIRATIVLVPWAAASGIGLLALSAGAHAVLAVLDIAGRADLAELEGAARSGKLAVGIASARDPAVTPLVQVAGFSDALSDATSLRRLAARELVQAVTDVRSILRGPAAWALLGTPVARYDTLTVNVGSLA